MATDAKFSLKLLIDDKRNKVLLAEVDQDFVDVLISLLTLPMGKVARLLENHKIVLSCFKNLNKSVEDMDIDHFETPTCKNMLLNPKNVKGIHCEMLELNMNDIDDTSLYVCPELYKAKGGSLCAKYYSMFNTSKCLCGGLMSSKIDVSEKEVYEVIEDTKDGVFVNCRSSFIVTDDMKVTESSIGVIMQVINDQGYLGFTDLRETLFDVGFEEVVTLMGCLFTSETPLTSAFLGKKSMKKMKKMPSPLVWKPSGIESSDSLYSVKVFVRKLDREILYAECKDDFIDSLVSFLVLPLDLAYSLSAENSHNTTLTCVGNLCRSPCRRESASSFYEFPDFYNCSSNEPFTRITHVSPDYRCLIPHSAQNSSSCKFTRMIKGERLLLTRWVELQKEGRIVHVFPIDSRLKKGSSSKSGDGFMKINTNFIVSNDLVITPMKSASMIELSKKMKLCPSDLEEHQINISKTELISILRASLISSSALNGLSNFLSKKVKHET